MLLARNRGTRDDFLVAAGHLDDGFDRLAQFPHDGDIGILNLGIEALADLNSPQVFAFIRGFGTFLADFSADKGEGVDGLIPVLEVVVAHTNVEVSHVCPLGLSSHFRKSAEKGNPAAYCPDW